MDNISDLISDCQLLRKFYTSRLHGEKSVSYYFLKNHVIYIICVFC